MVVIQRLVCSLYRGKCGPYTEVPSYDTCMLTCVHVLAGGHKAPCRLSTMQSV